MKLIKPKAELLLQQPGLEGVYKQIELAGRTCYKSTDKITEDSAKPFVDRMIKSNHLAMLEHGTVYLKMPTQGIMVQIQDHSFLSYTKNKYSVVNTVMVKDNPNDVIGILYAFVTTNLRVLIENGWLDDLQYLCSPTEYHEKRYTFRLVTSIGVTRELNRHRVNSIAEESTRYCNYTKDKFGRELTFVIPEWINLPEGNAYWADGLKNYRIMPDDSSQLDISIRPNEWFTEKEAQLYSNWLRVLDVTERAYGYAIKNGWKAQQARELLPLCLKSEIVHTAFASDWKHFFGLRYYGTTGAPHPNMKQLATLMKDELDKNSIKLD